MGVKKMIDSIHQGLRRSSNTNRDNGKNVSGYVRLSIQAKRGKT